MSLCETTRDADGAIRYYADGKRITRDRMREIKHDSRLDTFHTVRRGGLTRQYCCARKVAA